MRKDWSLYLDSLYNKWCCVYFPLLSRKHPHANNGSNSTLTWCCAFQAFWLPTIDDWCWQTWTWRATETNRGRHRSPPLISQWTCEVRIVNKSFAELVVFLFYIFLFIIKKKDSLERFTFFHYLFSSCVSLMLSCELDLFQFSHNHNMRPFWCELARVGFLDSVFIHGRWSPWAGLTPGTIQIQPWALEVSFTLP